MKIENSFSLIVPALKTGTMIMMCYLSYFQVVLFCSSVCNKEYRNNGYKQLFVLPVKKGKLFLSKQLLYIAVLTLSIFIYFLCYLLLVKFFSIRLNVPFKLLYDSNIVSLFIKIYIGILPLFSIQYLFSLLFKRYLIAIGIAVIGFALTFIAFGFDWKIAPYNPFGQSLYYLLNLLKGYIFGGVKGSTLPYIISLCEYGLFTAISYLYFTRYLNGVKR